VCAILLRALRALSLSSKRNTIVSIAPVAQDKATLRVPLPAGSRVTNMLVNGKAVVPRWNCGATEYATAEVEGRGPHRLQLELA